MAALVILVILASFLHSGKKWRSNIQFMYVNVLDHQMQLYLLIFFNLDIKKLAKPSLLSKSPLTEYVCHLFRILSQVITVKYSSSQCALV